MKRSIVWLAIFICINIFLVSTRHSEDKEKDNYSPDSSDEPESRSYSYSKSEVYSSSNVNGKRRSNYRKNESEVHRSKRKNKPEVVRKYWEKWHRKNGGPIKVWKKAYSNARGERKYLRNKWKRSHLDSRNHKVSDIFTKRISKRLDRRFRKFWKLDWKGWWSKRWKDWSEADKEFERRFRKSKFSKYLRKKRRELEERDYKLDEKNN